MLISEAAEIAMRMSREETRRRIGVWIDQLKRWDTDPYIRQHSKKLDHAGDNVYVLISSEDFLIFYALEEDGITILDVARKSAIGSFGYFSEAKQG